MSNIGEVKGSKKQSNLTENSSIQFWLLAIALSFIVILILAIGFILIDSLSGNSIRYVDNDIPQEQNEEIKSEIEEIIEIPEKKESTRSDAIKFNNQIVDLQIELITNFQKLGQALTTKDITLINAEYNSTLISANEAILELKNIEQINEGQGLYNAAENLFEFYFEVLENNYKEVIDAINAGEGNSDVQISELIKKIATEEVKLDVEFRKAQQKLADQYGFTLN